MLAATEPNRNNHSQPGDGAKCGNQLGRKGLKLPFCFPRTFLS